MSLMEIALRTGVRLADIEELARGSVPNSVGERLGVPTLALQEFIRHGQASSKMAHRIGTSMAAAEELSQMLGSEGRVGLVLGLLLGSSGFERQTAAAGV